METHAIPAPSGLLDGAVEDLSALVKDTDPAAELLDLAQEMRRQEDGEAELGVESSNGLAHLVNSLRIETIGGFVQDKQFGGWQQGLSQGKAGAHAVGIGADERLFAAREAYPLHDLAESIGRDSGGITRENLEVPPAAEIIVKHGSLEDRSHAGKCVGPLMDDVVAANPDLTRGGPDLPEQHADGGALPGTIVAEQSEDHSAGNVEIEAIHRDPLGKEFSERLKLDHGRAGSVSTVKKDFTAPSA